LPIKINYEDTWVAEDRWNWEAKDGICICAMDGYAESKTEEITRCLKDLLAEFSLPLQVRRIQTRERSIIKKLLRDSVSGHEIICQEFVDRLNDARPREPLLQPALVIAFEGKIPLRDKVSRKPDEPPEWGWTDPDGLILLRLVGGEPLCNVVRHEMGHLIGNLDHHPNCVMDWNCGEAKFCEECIERIHRTCQRE
jgi:hypothetical protein